MIDSETKASGCTSRHISACTFFMHAEMQKLKNAWTLDENFIEFNDRKSSYGTKQTCAYVAYYHQGYLATQRLCFRTILLFSGTMQI